MAVGLQPDLAAEPVVEEEIPFLGRLYRLSIEQYHRMIEAEVIGPDDRVELLEGLLVAKMGTNPPHIIATDLITLLMTRILPAGWFLSMGNPVTLETTSSEPEPDAKIVRGHPRDYRDRKPGPGDVGVVIEVSDSTLRTDRTVKKRIYARDAVPFYWMLNLVDHRLEVFSEPEGADYKTHQIYGPEDTVPLILDGREVARIAVKDLLP